MTIKECLAVALIGIFLMMVEPAHSCDCTAYAIDALKSVHIRLRTVPALAEDYSIKHKGAYANGLVLVKDVDDCHTVLHEFVHHAQWLKYGSARSAMENYQREMDASVVTMNAEVEYGRCL